MYLVYCKFTTRSNRENKRVYNFEIQYVPELRNEIAFNIYLLFDQGIHTGA